MTSIVGVEDDYEKKYTRHWNTGLHSKTLDSRLRGNDEATNAITLAKAGVRKKGFPPRSLCALESEANEREADFYPPANLRNT